MAKREWFPKQKDILEKNKNMIVYVLAAVGGLGCLVAWGLLPDQVSINPNMDDMIQHAKNETVAFHFGIIAVFTGLFWKWPREWAYLFGALFGVAMLYLMLYANLGI